MLLLRWLEILVFVETTFLMDNKNSLEQNCAKQAMQNALEFAIEKYVEPATPESISGIMSNFPFELENIAKTLNTAKVSEIIVEAHLIQNKVW